MPPPEVVLETPAEPMFFSFAFETTSVDFAILFSKIAVGTVAVIWALCSRSAWRSP